MCSQAWVAARKNRGLGLVVAGAALEGVGPGITHGFGQRRVLNATTVQTDGCLQKPGVFVFDGIRDQLVVERSRLLSHPLRDARQHVGCEALPGAEQSGIVGQRPAAAAQLAPDD